MTSAAARRYLIHDPVRRNAFRVIDSVLSRLPSAPVGALPTSPRRILLALSGHLGDAIIATSAIAVTRELLPDAEIGVLVGSWSRSAVEGNPLVDRVHVVDHWILNRTAPGIGTRVRRFVSTWRGALREIQRGRYEMAIDLYPYWPNSALLLKLAGIPARVGYTSGGYGPLYTHPMEFPEETGHQVEQQAEFIATALGGSWDRDRLHYRLPPVGAAALASAAGKLAAVGIAAQGYVVAHMSAATTQREWVVDKWRETLGRLAEDGHQIVCTGLAGREADLARRAIDGFPGCATLCGQLSWEEVLAVLSNARVVVSVDTAVAHAAAAFDVPTVTLMPTIIKPEHWRPYHDRGTALSHPMPCAPCYARAGCEHMSCVRGVSVDQVLTAVQGALRTS